MEVTAKLSNFRSAPRKTRLVADLIRGKAVPQAQAILLFTVNKPARAISKLLNSAVASAKHNHQLDETKLFISKITVDEGIRLKRWHPMSRGRAFPIQKRASHIAIVLSDKDPKAKETKPEVKPEIVIAKSAKKETKKAIKPRKKAVKKQHGTQSSPKII